MIPQDKQSCQASHSVEPADVADIPEKSQVAVKGLFASLGFKIAMLGVVASVGLGSVAFGSYLSSIPAAAGTGSATSSKEITVDDLAAERLAALEEASESVDSSSKVSILSGRQHTLISQGAAIEAEADRITNLSTFLWPTKGNVGKGNGFGPRYHPILHYTRLHSGVDIGGKCGAPIYAAQSGTVTVAEGGYNSGSGIYIRIDHGDINGIKVETAYLHLSEILVNVDQKVNKGELIGKVGETGLATSCHLHLSLYKDGISRDPLEYVKKDPAQAAADAKDEPEYKGPMD